MISTTMFPVRYAETDQMGIVHHSVYPVWYEAARTDFMIAMGFSYSAMEQAGIYCPLIEVHCNFKKPVKYGQDVAVTAQIKRMSPVVIEMEYAVYIEGSETPVNTGSTVHTLVNSDFKLINLKKTRADIYELFQNSFEE